jgi:hypothetical protein
MTGAVAVVIAYFTNYITTDKISNFFYHNNREIGGELAFGSAFLYLLAFNVGLGVLAWLTVFVEPLSAGSGTQYLFWYAATASMICITSPSLTGIPEVKCFLNGLNIPRLVNVRTLICKSIGNIQSFVNSFKDNES